MEQVHFDAFEAQEVIENSRVEFKNEDDTLEDNFEEMQIDSMNFIKNTGSLVVPILPWIFIQQYLIIEGSIKILKLFTGSKIARSIGKVIMSQKLSVSHQYGTMLYEGYMELCLATCLNSMSLYYALKADRSGI